MQEKDPSLDQIINLFNKPTLIELPAIKIRSNKTIQSQKNIIINPKYLIFKPWSGSTALYKENWRNSETQEPIKQQIQAKQDDVSPEKEQFAELSNAAQDNQIGYFYKFQSGHVKLIKYLLDQNGFKYANANKNWSIYWASGIIKNEVYKQILPYQKVNHFPNSFHITRKDLMNKCISKMQDKFGGSHFNFLPKTYILPQQYELLKDQMNKYKLTYIVKPHNRSQGKGITVTTSEDVIQSKLQKYSSLIVSHYIENPLLINKLKFDLRIYVGITSVNPLRIYVYEEGLARFATEAYDHTNQDSQNKKFQHLTNYSINKKNTQFLKPNQNQEYFGSKWSLTSMKDFLTFNIGKTETDQLFQRINDLIVKTIISVENIVFTAFMQNVPYINGCFQVLGFDILIDSNLKPWLVEVNLSPSMNTDSPLDLKIKGNMISELLTMSGVVPLSDRYLDGGHMKYEISNYKKSDLTKSEPGSLIDKFVIKMTQQEYNRKGKWNRVFPVRSNRYKNFFDTDRYFNRVLRQGLIQPIYKNPLIMMENTYTSANNNNKKYQSNRKKSLVYGQMASNLNRTSNQKQYNSAIGNTEKSSKIKINFRTNKRKF